MIITESIFRFSSLRRTNLALHRGLSTFTVRGRSGAPPEHRLGPAVTDPLLIPRRRRWSDQACRIVRNFHCTSTNMWTSHIPTFDKLGARIAPDTDPVKVATEWFERFSAAVTNRGPYDGLMQQLFAEDAYWRDILALTWDFRTFQSAPCIFKFLQDRLESTGFKPLHLQADQVRLQMPYPDVAWILATFSFETTTGLGTGVFRLVPTPDGSFKAYTMFTNLDDLKGFPELVASNRYSQSRPGEVWLEDRAREVDFASSDPAVVIVGGGHCGLALAARLKYLGVPALVVESAPRLGDNWRSRYDALCLHWPIYVDNMPYLPFPPTWPLYTPAPKLANWLEFYADTLDLNVWNSSTVVQASQSGPKKWQVTVDRNGTQRVLNVNHLVLATGMGAPHVPNYPGREAFPGTVIHSADYKTARDYPGKQVVVVGTGNSGHDVAADCARNGLDITMCQRDSTYVMDLRTGWKFMGGALYSEGAPPTEIADKLFNSMPPLLSARGLAQRTTAAIAENDREILEGLQKVGFKLNRGIDDAGVSHMLRSRGGGHYFNVGASNMIIEGKIKIKNDSLIKTFSPSGLEFEDGSSLSADVVIFATGLRPVKDYVRYICGDKVADETDDILGMDQEAEFRGCWRPIGPKGLWYMSGSLHLARMHSKHLALQIKAMEEGVYSTLYR